MTTPAFSPRIQWWINRGGFALIWFCAVSITIATFAPHRFDIGAIGISFRGVRNPMLGLLVGYAMWRTTYDGFGRWLKERIDQIGSTSGEFSAHLERFGHRAMRLLKNWGWRQRAILVLAIAQVVYIMRFWQSYPAQLDFQRIAQANMYRLAAFGDPGSEMPLLEHFCREICEQTPPDARILFHGRTPAMRLAYEVYPRRVFILPQEMTAMAESWHVQPQLRELPPDPHEPYWHQFLPHVAVDPAEFIREHRINYVATFDEYDLGRCRVEPAP